MALTRAQRVTGAVLALAIGMAFLSVGLWAVSLMARVWWAEARVYGWSEATATIVEASTSAPARANQDPSLSVRFRYDYNGSSYESDRVSVRPSARDHDAYRLAGLWQPGSTWPCYVDPRNPRVAVLRRDSLWWGFAVLLPLAVGGGLGALFLYAAWVSIRPRPASNPSLRPIAKVVVRWTAATLAVICLVVTTYFFGVRPLALFLSARYWRASPCRIVASRIATQSNGMRTGYRADIVFRYRFDGTERVSSDDELVENGNRSFHQAAEIVQRYPPGAGAVCYVDPRNPTQAVLDRSLPAAAPFGLLPFGLLVAIGWGLVASARRRER